MWQGIKAITDYAGNNTSSTQTLSLSLPEELNRFFSRFDCVDTSNNITQTQQEPPSSVLVLRPHEVRWALNHINPVARLLGQTACQDGS